MRGNPAKPFPPVSAKVRYSQYRNWRRHISHSHLNFQVPKVSLEAKIVLQAAKIVLQAAKIVLLLGHEYSFQDIFSVF